MASNILPLFWHLSSNDRKTRLEASESLVGSLVSFQDQFRNSKATSSIHTNGNTSGSTTQDGMEVDDQEDAEEQNEDDSDESGVEVSDDDDEDDEDTLKQSRRSKASQGDAETRLDTAFEAENSEDVRYSVKRLVRGLASSRESARLGFAVALTELLTRVPELNPTHVISLILRSSQTNKSLKGTEQRDLLFARLFGLTAVVDSTILFKSEEATLEDLKTTLGELWNLGDKKSWLRESAWWTILKAVQDLLTSEVAWRDAAISAITKLVYGDTETDRGMAWTQEKVALTLVLQSKLPDLDWKTLLAPAFRHGDILASANFPILSKILKETADAEDVDAPSGEPKTHVQTGNWKPQVHFVWDVVFLTYFPDNEKSGQDIAESTSASFIEFWRVVVDDGLFNPNSTPQRKFWGFSVVEQAIRKASSDQLPTIFTPNFMKTWMNQLSNQDRYLHKAAQHVARTLQDAASSNAFVGFTLLTQLLGQHGSQNFDRITKTKTVEGIMSRLDAEGVTKYLQYLMQSFNSVAGTHDVTALETQRIWACEQMANLIRNSSVPKEDSSIWSILQHLCLYGFFQVRKANPKSICVPLHVAPASAVSQKVSDVCRARIFGCLIDLTTSQRSNRSTEEHSKPSSYATDSTGKLWLTRCQNLIEMLSKDTKHVSSIIDVDSEIEAARQAGLKALQALPKESGLQADVKQGISILLNFAIIKSYDDDVKAYESLEDITQCAQKLCGAGPSTSKQADDLPPIDLLVDALVGYLDQGSSDLKTLAGHVFGLVSTRVSQSTVEHLIAQLEESGPGNVSDDEDEDEDGEQDDEGLDDGEDSASSSEGEDQEDEEDANATVDPEFRKRIAEALQVNGMTDGQDESNADGSESADDSDEDDDNESITMDDDQMLALDDKLAAIFKQQKASGQRGTTASIVENMHFKSRVLDLIEVYLRKQASNSLGFQFIPSLLRVSSLTGTQEKSVATKAANILARRFEKTEDVPSVGADSKVPEALSEVHEIARGASSKEIAKLCSLCSIAIAKALAHSGQQQAVVDAYSRSLKDFMTRKNSRLPPSFFLDLIQRQPLVGWLLRNELIRYATEGAVNGFHQEEAFKMLVVISKQLAVVSKSTETPEVQQFVIDCRSAIYSALSSVASGKLNWNANRVKEVIRVALQIARYSAAIFSDDIARIWSAAELQEINQRLLTAETTKSTPSVFTLLNQLSLLVDPAAKQAQAEKKQQKQEKKRKREVGEPDKTTAESTSEKKSVKPAADVKKAAKKPVSGKADAAAPPPSKKVKTKSKA